MSIRVLGATFTSWSFANAFVFRKKKHDPAKKQLVMVQDLIPPPSIYLHVCTLYTCTNTYMPRFSSYGFFGTFKCLVLTLGFTSVYSTFSMCVFVRVHTRTPTYAPTSGPSMSSCTLNRGWRSSSLSHCKGVSVEQWTYIMLFAYTESLGPQCT